MKLLVTGAGGMTGSKVALQASSKGWDCVAYTRADLDVSDRSAVENTVSRLKPDVIINAAGYTAVDAAESNPDEAMTINAAGAGNIALAAKRNDAMIIHISTDYVFDGTCDRPYRPADATSPINAYGETKLAGEIAVREAGGRHSIVRTSWVYSHDGKNFVRTMLRAAQERAEIRVVNDQHGRPTSATDLAAALLRVAEEMWKDRNVSGTFHFANSGATTWFDFAVKIFELRGGSMPIVTPIATEQFPTPARRPRRSVLDTTSFEQTFGVTPRSWQTALAETMTQIQ